MTWATLVALPPVGGVAREFVACSCKAEGAAPKSGYPGACVPDGSDPGSEPPGVAGSPGVPLSAAFAPEPVGSNDVVRTGTGGPLDGRPGGVVLGEEAGGAG